MIGAMERNEAFAEGWIKGWLEGWQKGWRETQIREAKIMIAQGFDEKSIHAISELPVDEIRKLAGTLA